MFCGLASKKVFVPLVVLALFGPSSGTCRFEALPCMWPVSRALPWPAPLEWRVLVCALVGSRTSCTLASANLLPVGPNPWNPKEANLSRVCIFVEEHHVTFDDDTMAVDTHATQTEKLMKHCKKDTCQISRTTNKIEQTREKLQTNNEKHS